MSNSFQKLSDHFVQSAIEHHTKYQGEPSDTVKELISNNLSYFNDHCQYRGVDKNLERKYLDHKAIVKTFTEMNTSTPLEGDRVIVTATGGKGPIRTYQRALVTAVDGDEVTVCVKPYVPFMANGISPSGLALSVSGGYRMSAPASEFALKGLTPSKFVFWGTTPMANGSVEFQQDVRQWAITSKLFY